MSIVQAIMASIPYGGGGSPATYLPWTVEMWIKHGTQTDNYPRVFDVGAWPQESLGYSAEPGGEYFWTGGQYDVTNMAASRNGAWHHIAWTSDGTNLMSFLDGQLLNTVPRARLVDNSSQALSIGAGNTGGNGWVGYITNFHITRSCKYNGNFSVITDPILADGGSELLLQVYDPQTSLTDSSGKNRQWSVNEAGVYFSTDTPLSSGGSLQFSGGNNWVAFPAGPQWALDVQ